MTTGISLRTLAVAVAWLGTASGSSGLTLGAAQGLALVGQPLDVRVAVQFDAREDAQSACLRAEVAYGDNPLDPTRVSVEVDSDSDPGREQGQRMALVRVRASVPVNEPVVTITLRSGCQVRSSRRYTLLAEPPTQVVASQRAVAPVAARVPVAPVKAPPQARSEPAPAASEVPRPRTGPRKTPATQAVPAAAAPVPAWSGGHPPVVAPRSAKVANRARLKLDPLDLLIERDPVLRSTDTLLSVPQEAGNARADAVARWRALNTTPEQLLREEVQAQRAQSELKQLYTVTHQNQKGLIDLAGQVERAESERYANGLVYALVALCVAALAVLVWLWQRVRVVQVVPDWRVGQDADDSLMAELLASKAHLPRDAERVRATPPSAAPLAQASSPQRTASPAAHTASADVDFDLDGLDTASARSSPRAVDPWAAPAAAVPSAWRTLDAPPMPTTDSEGVHAAAQGGIDFSVSLSPSMRSIDTEELEDIRHQAEFFVSLGQHDRAVEILTTRIAQCGESSPLVCLDLLRIYHMLELEPEYNFMRAEFQHWFTGRVPAFADFGSEGRALDRYTQVMDRIVQLWPSVRVLEYIEDCLYQHTGTVDGQAFDLQAYRDLLLLHTVAKRIIRMGEEGASADGHVPDGVRIPARAQTALVSDASDNRRASTHRAAGQWRGALQTGEGWAGVDPQADVPTRGVPLGQMKVPPTAVADTPPPGRTQPVAPGGQTDFDFLNLR